MPICIATLMASAKTIPNAVSKLMGPPIWERSRQKSVIFVRKISLQVH